MINFAGGSELYAVVLLANVGYSLVPLLVLVGLHTLLRNASKSCIETFPSVLKFVVRGWLLVGAVLLASFFCIPLNALVNGKLVLVILETIAIGALQLLLVFVLVLGTVDSEFEKWMKQKWGKRAHNVLVYARIMLPMHWVGHQIYLFILIHGFMALEN